MSVEVFLSVVISVLSGAQARDWGVVGRHQVKAVYPPNWDEFWREVYQRAGYRCQNYGAKNVKVHTHHFVPLSLGGTNELSNLACLCEGCHGWVHPQMQ